MAGYADFITEKGKGLFSHENKPFCVPFGGDKRDRTADLLNAIQALSRTIGYAPPDGLGKDLNIPPRQLMRDKLQYSIEGICCQLDIPLRYVPLAVVVARVRAYCAMGSS